MLEAKEEEGSRRRNLDRIIVQRERERLDKELHGRKSIKGERKREREVWNPGREEMVEVALAQNDGDLHTSHNTRQKDLSSIYLT